MKEIFKGWSLFEKVWLFVASALITVLSLYWKDSWIGIVSSLTGVICVILTAKGKISCYVFGTINTVLYAYIAYKSQYYGDFILNAFYFLPLQFVGWSMWKKHMNSNNEVRAVELTRNKKIGLFALCLGAVGVLGFILKSMGGSLPFVDATSTVLSVLAMYLSIKRYVEQWVLWIVVDVVTIIMWVVAMVQGGNDIATLIMWIAYLINAVYGYMQWKKLSQTQIC